MRSISSIYKKKKIKTNKNIFDIGYIYVPYIPVQSITIEVTFQPTRDLMSSYSVVEINKDFFSEITI